MDELYRAVRFCSTLKPKPPKCLEVELPQLFTSRSTRSSQERALTDVNYELARRTLMERFDNKRFIVSMHLSAMLSYPNLKTEDETEASCLLVVA